MSGAEGGVRGLEGRVWGGAVGAGAVPTQKTMESGFHIEVGGARGPESARRHGSLRGASAGTVARVVVKSVERKKERWWWWASSAGREGQLALWAGATITPSILPSPITPALSPFFSLRT